jgi:hypothetical protein
MAEMDYNIKLQKRIQIHKNKGDRETSKLFIGKKKKA